MSDKILSERPLITGMGAALVDLFADVDEPALDALGSPKGSMTLVDAARASALRDTVKVHTYHPGGSAANTVAGLAGLGMPSGFIGKIGDDELGRVFRDSLTDLGVTFPVTPCDAADHPTGNCLVLVTPDAERTMHTLLGVRHHGHGRSGCQTIERNRNSLLRRLCLGQPDRTRGLSGSRGPRQIGWRAHRLFIIRYILRRAAQAGFFRLVCA